MMTREEAIALLGDHEAAKRLTEEFVGFNATAQASHIITSALTVAPRWIGRDEHDGQ